MENGDYRMLFSADGRASDGRLSITDGRAVGGDGSYAIRGRITEAGRNLIATFEVKLAPGMSPNKEIEGAFALQMDGKEDAAGFTLIGAGPLGLIVEITCSIDGPSSSAGPFDGGVSEDRYGAGIAKAQASPDEGIDAGIVKDTLPGPRTRLSTYSLVPTVTPIRRLPLVLLHLFGGSRREWDAVTARFAADRRVLALDLPGFGDAAGRGGASVGEMADSVGDAIVHAGLGRCVLVGHSMSAKVAAVLVATAPDLFEGLILVTASPPSPEPMSDEARARLLAFDGSRAAAEAYVDGITAKRLPDEAREIAIADARRASPDAWRRWLTEGSCEDHGAAVGVLPLATLLMAGASDEALGQKAQREFVMPHFADARLVVVRGGHALPLENPDDLSREIERFVADVEARDA